MLLIIFFIVGVCPFWGFRSADILVSSAFDHSAATLAFCSVLTVRRPGRAGSGGRTGRAGRAGRAAEGWGGGFGRSCRAVDGEAGRGGTGRLSRGRRRSCRACCSVRPCREAEACRMEGPGWLSRVVAQDGGGCVGRSRWAAEVSGGGGHVGRRMERPNGDGPGGRGRPPLPHACRWSVPVSVPVSVSVPSRKSDVRRGKTAPKLVFARTKAYL